MCIFIFSEVFNMRRLWAHVLIASAAIVAVFATFPSTVRSIRDNNVNGDFELRREFTFQLSERENESQHAALNENSAKEMAKTMEDRLVKAGVTSYEINTSGEDLVKVTFKADDDTEYQQITTYLSFSGSFALLNRNDDVIVGSDFLNGNAYLKSGSVNEYPTVIVPIQIKESARTAYDDLITWSRDNPIASTKTNDEGEEETSNSYEVYLIYNYVEGDTYQTLIDRNQFNQKILITLDNSSDDTLYYNADKNSFSQICGYQDSNSNGTADPNEIRTAFNQADFLVNLFSASALDYDVKVIKGLNTPVYVNAALEQIYARDQILMTSIIAATLAAIVVLAGVFVWFFGLSALSATATTLVSAFLTYGFLVITGLEFNLLGVLGMVTVAALTIISNVIYLHKLREESFRGRTLKKANAEAAKRSLLPILDLHIVAAVVGLVFFLVGGAALHTFSSLLLIGSLISFLISVFGIRGLMWLSTNTTKLTGKYNVFGIKNEDVPNHMQEEQQRYYGAYADKDFTSKAKPISIVGLSLAFLSLVGVILMGTLNNGNLFNTAPSKVLGSEILVTNVIDTDKEETSPVTQNYVEDLFSNIKLYSADEKPSDVTWGEEDKHATLSSYVDKIVEYTVSNSETEEGTTLNTLTTYYQVTLIKVLDGDNTYAVIKDEAYTQTKMTLNEVFNDYFEEVDDSFSRCISNELSLKTIESVKKEQAVKWDLVLIAMAIASGVITLYLMIRYGLSRGIASLAAPVVMTLIVLGFFVLAGVIGSSLSASIMAFVPVSSIVFYAFFIMFASKEKEMVQEDKIKDETPEHRKEISKRAIAISASPIIKAACVVLLLNLMYFGFSSAASQFDYMAILLGVVIALVAILYTFSNLSNVLYKAFSSIKIEKPKKNKKGGHQPKQKSAEPEEAIFIGIND